MPDHQNKRRVAKVRYIEFYSGIGGWAMALRQAVQRVFPANDTDLQCCAALDHSDLCTAVYQHNFGKEENENKKPKPIRIETLTVSQLAAWKADLWMMSPPCQPHTRQHNRQHADLHDERSQSFLHLCRLLAHSDWDDVNCARQQKQRPTWILLENVVGFERSQSCKIWLQSLDKAGYAYQQFHLQPTQVGLPNDRPRYYCVAALHNRLETKAEQWIRPNASHPSCFSPNIIRTALEECGVLAETSLDPNQLPKISSFLDDAKAADAVTCAQQSQRLCLSNTLLQKPAAWCLDIVTRDCRRSSCFTSSYGRYFKGTGSVLLVSRVVSVCDNRTVCGDAPPSSSSPSCSVSETASQSTKLLFHLVPPEQRKYDPLWNEALLTSSDNDDDNGLYLRFFSPSELARLLDFAQDFAFPNGVSLSQQWKLLGNSINVRVAARLVELALRAVAVSVEDATEENGYNSFYR